MLAITCYHMLKGRSLLFAWFDEVDLLHLYTFQRDNPPPLSSFSPSLVF